VILDWLSPKTWLAGIGAAALVGVSAYGLGRVHGGDKVRAKWDQAKAEQAAVALKATKDNAAKQVRWIDNTLTAANERKTNEATTADLRARLAATERRLRDASTANGGRVPEAAADSCNQDLAEARRNLATCGASLAGFGLELVEREDDARELTEAWPR